MGDPIPLRRRPRSFDELGPANRRKRRGGRHGRRGLPPEWTPYLRRRSLLPDAELRIMLWTGLIFGLLAFQALRLWPEPASAPAPMPRIEAPADPFREARRSRAILQAQEGAPGGVASPRPAEGSGRVSPAGVRVIDGDTFDYGGERIRIADIDTPEVNGRCPYESGLAARATARMRALLVEGPFELRPDPGGRDQDRYGRSLRIVTRHGRSLGDVLVAEGLARPWTGRRRPWCG